jgi:hypothetical protein
MKKIKLMFSIEMAMKSGVCKRGINLFKEYLDKNNIKYTNKTKFNVLTLLKSNNVDDTIWALRLDFKRSKSVIIEFSRRAASRAAEYAASSAYAACSADAERQEQILDLLDLLEE